MIWTEHSTLILQISIPLEVAQQKFQDFYNLGRNEFSPNLKGVAQKMDLPRSFEVLDIFGRKSKSEAPRALTFGPKQVPIKVNQECLKLPMNIAGSFFELHPPNLLRIHFPPSCRYAKILVTLPQTV